MALSVCNHQPLFCFSIQNRRIPLNVKFVNAHFNQENSKFRFFSTHRRFEYIFRTRSASVNGYPSSNDDKDSIFQENQEVRLSEKLKRWIKFVGEILPGGEWWRLSTEEIDVGLSAKPGTVFRALQKMWELISHDRWFVFGGFLALIVTAAWATQ